MRVRWSRRVRWRMSWGVRVRSGSRVGGADTRSSVVPDGFNINPHLGTEP